MNQSIRVIGLMMLFKVMANMFGVMVERLKGNGKTISFMERACLHGLTVGHT